jgi:peptidylprolyl isomerase
VRRLAVLFTAVSFALVGATAGAVDAAGAAATPLAPVKVSGAVGAAPTLKFAKPFAVKTSAHQVTTTGTGPALVKGQNVSFDYLIVDGRTGKQLESSFGKTSGALPLDAKQTTPALVKSLLGATVGSRVLVAFAPKDGLTKSVTTPGVKKTDTLLFVLDVKSATTPLKRATGDAVAPVAGLPTVTLGTKGKPTITVPSTTAAPTTLVVQPLIKGTGPVVAAAQTITVHYTGVIWATGKQFDSSWDRGTTAQFVIGTGRVIPGWDEGLVGQTVGSQVLLVVPPDKGYGTAGQSSAGISGTDTLVFVVDILDAT